MIQDRLQWLRRVILLSLVMLTGTIHASASELTYAQPFTGKSVSSYQVDLFVRQKQKIEFQVPDNCSKIEQAYAHGADQWGSQVDRFLWGKVINDCRYTRYVKSTKTDGIGDYVSKYDYMNARIADFPMRWDCDFNEPLPKTGCTPIHYAVPDVSRLPAFERGNPDSDDLVPDACKLQDGLFRGRIVFSQQGLYCRRDPAGPGFRIISVDFSDVNADGYMDAIIRLVPIGKRVSRVPMIYVLTRYSANEPFSTLALK